MHGGQRIESDIRERGWVSGLYAIGPDGEPRGRPETELGVPPERHRGGMHFEPRAIVLEPGRLVLFPSYVFHSLQAPDEAKAQAVITFDAVPD